MSFQRTAAHSSRISKPGSRRSSASIFSSAKRKKPAQAARSKALRATQHDESAFNDRLEDHGVITRLPSRSSSDDVAQQITYIRAHMFAEIPERGSGMNSVRIAEVLNFRRSLPPVVSVAHIHALASSATKTERDIARLTSGGVARRIHIPGRGTGADAVGEGIVMVDEWQRLVQLDDGLSEDVRAKYCHALAHPAEMPTFSQQEVTALLRAGFLNGASVFHSDSDILLRPGVSTIGTLAAVSSAGSTHISGTADAAAQNSSREHITGGSGSSERMSSAPSAAVGAAHQYVFSLPNMGPYLKLLVDARNHLVSLLARSSKYREMPKDLLKDRWDGGILGSDEASRAAKIRGEFKGVLPGRTKKWKQFYGLEFEWVLEECLGAGLVECFKTGSVGIGVRLTE